jgi:hypothetical protein
VETHFGAIQETNHAEPKETNQGKSLWKRTSVPFRRVRRPPSSTFSSVSSCPSRTTVVAAFGFATRVRIKPVLVSPPGGGGSQAERTTHPPPKKPPTPPPPGGGGVEASGHNLSSHPSKNFFGAFGGWGSPTLPEKTSLVRIIARRSASVVAASTSTGHSSGQMSIVAWEGDKKAQASE